MSKVIGVQWPHRVSATLLALLAISSPAFAQRTRVILLGTGTPNANPDRSGPAVAIVVDSSVYVVDAGPGVVRRVAAAARDTKLPALTMERLRVAFLTHLHSDHTLGLPDLMFSPWVLGRTVPLEVYGPPGTKAMVEHLRAAYAEDVDIRLNGGEPSNKTGYGGVGHDATAGVVYRDRLVAVTAFEVPHGKWKHAYGYRFSSPDRTVVISGDTHASDAVAKACNGCDVLVLRCHGTSEGSLLRRTIRRPTFPHPLQQE
jgi:ribonuclease BN (tRNA processing enzyme)